MPLIENVWFSIRFVDILFPLIENVLFSIRAKVLCWLGQRTVLYPRPVLHVLIETNLLFVYIICNTISLQQYYTLHLCPYHCSYAYYSLHSSYEENEAICEILIARRHYEYYEAGFYEVNLLSIILIGMHPRK